MANNFEAWQVTFFLANLFVLVAEIAILVRPSDRKKMKWNEKRVILTTAIAASSMNLLWHLDPQFTVDKGTVMLHADRSIFGVRWSHTVDKTLYFLHLQLLFLCFVLLVLYYRSTAAQFECSSPREKISSMRQLLRHAGLLVALDLALALPFIALEEVGDSAESKEAAVREGNIVSLVFVVVLALAGEVYSRRIERYIPGSRTLAEFSRKVRQVCRLGLLAILGLAGCFCWRYTYIASLPRPQPPPPSGVGGNATDAAGSVTCRGEAGGASTAWCRNYFGFMWSTSLIETALFVLLLTAVSPNSYRYMRRAAARLSAVVGLGGAGDGANWEPCEQTRARGIGSVTGSIDWGRVRAGSRQASRSVSSSAGEPLIEVQPVELPHPPGDASKRPQLAPLKLGSLPEHDQESSADGSAFFETQNPAFEDGGDHDGVADGHDTESHGLRTPYSLMLS